MPVTRYVSANGRLRGEITSGTRTDYLTDALGSVTATVNSLAAVANTYRFKPYGQQLAKTGSGADPRYLWTGDTGSRRTNLNRAEQYSVYRHYGSQQAAWTTVDPIWPSEQAYAYGQGQPTLHHDPLGLAPQKGQKPIKQTPYFCLTGLGLIRGCLPPSPCATSDVCKSLTFGSATFALTVCCDGIVRICLNKGMRFKQPGVIACIRAHEEQHKKDLICDPCGTNSNSFRDGEIVFEVWYPMECRGSTVGLDCLRNSRKNCTTTACREEHDDALRIECRNVQQRCGKFGNNPEYQARRKYCISIGFVEKL